MTPEHNDKAASVPATARGADVLVVSAMAVVAFATTVALVQQAGLAPGAATGAGCAMFAFFVASHALFGGGKKRTGKHGSHARRKRPAAPPSAASETSAPGIATPEIEAPLEPAEAPLSSPSLGGTAFDQQGAIVPESAPPELTAVPVVEPSYPPPLPELVLPRPVEAASPPPVPRLGTFTGRVPFSSPPDAEGRPAGLQDSPAPSAAPVSPSDPMQSYWSYAPGAARVETPMPRVPFTSGTAPAASGDRESVSASAPASPRQEDVDVIHSLIKKLADEVNAAEQGEALRIEAEREAQAVEPPRVPAPPVSPPALPPSIESSLDALRTAASSMRAATPPPVPQEAVPAAPASTSGGAIMDALRAGRMDVLLEPIMGLDDQRARHYEVTLRLRTASGETLNVDGERAGLAGGRVLPLVDAVKLVRTANVADRLSERGKSGSVFSSYAGESLADRGFLADVVTAMRSRPQTAGQLILSFTQDDVRGFQAPEWGALGELRALGFRFALSDVTDLDMDFELLARLGFTYAKLDADVFLDGLQAPSGFLPASDVCRHLASQGLTLVVDRIDSEMKRVRIFGFGVLLGQGQLFGVPRPVKADATGAPRTAAA